MDVKRMFRALTDFFAPLGLPVYVRGAEPLHPDCPFLLLEPALPAPNSYAPLTFTGWFSGESAHINRLDFSTAAGLLIPEGGALLPLDEEDRMVAAVYPAQNFAVPTSSGEMQGMKMKAEMYVYTL